MWVLIAVTFITYGTPQGAISVHDLRFYSETACKKAESMLNNSHTGIKAFCVYDDTSSSVLKGLEGVEKGLDNSFGKTKKR